MSSRRRSSSSSSGSSVGAPAPLPRTVSSAVRRLSNYSRASRDSHARESLPRQPQSGSRVRFRSDAHLAAVAKLPKAQASDARASRRGGWESAPDDDVYWDGEERSFREKELTPDELVDILKERRKQQRRGVRLLSLFSRPNYRARVHQQLAAQGTYRDPLDILDKGSARLFMPRDGDEDADERAHREALEREHGIRRRSPPRLEAAKPLPSVLKTRRRQSHRHSPRRDGDSGAGLPERPPRSDGRRGRGHGFSMHRDSIFALRMRRRAELDWYDIGVLATGAGLVLVAAMTLALRVVKPALGLKSSAADTLAMLVMLAAVLAGAATAVTVLPQGQRTWLRERILELGFVDSIVLD